MKEFVWNGYTVQITKKKVKNANLRIKPETPTLIHMSIPYQMSYDGAVQMLKTSRIIRWLENYQKKLQEKPVSPRMQNWERMQQEPYYRQRLKEILPGLLRKWESAMGVKSRKVTIRDTRSQWGSCNTRNGNISISVWLGAFPLECIEYVVVHELAHLLEPGHNVHFYRILDQYYPNWKSCREQLKNGLASS